MKLYKIVLKCLDNTSSITICSNLSKDDAQARLNCKSTLKNLYTHLCMVSARPNNEFLGSDNKIYKLEIEEY